jgi:hypothetical protein
MIVIKNLMGLEFTEKFKITNVSNFINYVRFKIKYFKILKTSVFVFFDRVIFKMLPYNNYLLKFSIVDYSFKDLRPSTVYGLHNLKIYLFLLLFLLKHESRNFINLRYP